MRKINKLPNIWAILPEELDKIKSQVENVKAEDLQGFFVDKKSLSRMASGFFIDGKIGVLPIEGVIQPKWDIWTWFFGGTSLDILTRDFNLLLDDNSVDTIVLDIDSPGGVVSCVQEFANIIFNARNKKPIYAVTSATMASAAYWIGAAAEEVFVTDEAAVTGSIGVVTSHVDISELEKKLGIKTTEIVAGKKKRITSSLAPLSEEGRAELQTRVDHIYNAFVKDIAKFRGVDTETVLSDMADGQIFLGSQGVEAGLVDEVAPTEDILDRINAAIEGTKSNDNIFYRGKSMTITKSKKENLALTVDSVKQDYPEVYDSIFNIGVDATAETVNQESFVKGKAEGIIEGKAEGIKEGAKAEAERIKSVEEQSLPGHEALIAKMKFDGVTSGEKAAVAILAAERTRNTKGLKTLAQESTKPVEEEIEEVTKDDKSKTLEARWEASKELRAEFGDSFESFKAYEENVKKGNIRVFNPNRRG